MSWTRADLCCASVFFMALLISASPALAAGEDADAFAQPDQALLESVFDEFSKVGLDLENPLHIENLPSLSRPQRELNMTPNTKVKTVNVKIGVKKDHRKPR